MRAFLECRNRMHLQHITVHFVDQSWKIRLIQPCRKRRDHKPHRSNNRSQRFAAMRDTRRVFLSAQSKSSWNSLNSTSCAWAAASKDLAVSTMCRAGRSSAPKGPGNGAMAQRNRDWFLSSFSTFSQSIVARIVCGSLPDQTISAPRITTSIQSSLGLSQRIGERAGPQALCQR